MSSIYKVAEVAKLLNISRKTAYRYIDKIPLDCVTDCVTVTKNDTGVTTKFITEIGLQWIKENCNITTSETVKLEQSKLNDNSSSDIVLGLMEQLKQKDIQLSEKDKQIETLQEQINTLLEQSKNYQVLLQGQQVLSLRDPKKSLLKRLFSRSSE